MKIINKIKSGLNVNHQRVEYNFLTKRPTSPTYRQLNLSYQILLQNLGMEEFNFSIFTSLVLFS